MENPACNGISRVLWHSTIEEAVESFSPGNGRVRVDAFERFGEGVEQRPCLARLEFLVWRLSPVSQDFGNLAGCDSTAVCGLDYKVMGSGVVQGGCPIGLDAVFQLDKVCAKLSDCTSGQLTEIPDRKSCVFAPDLNQSGERQVVADKDLGSGNETCREGFVVGVSQANHPSMSVLWHVAELGHFEEAEVAVAFVADCVGLTKRVESCIGQLILYLLHEMTVRKREPGIGSTWGLDVKEGAALNDLSTAMQKHAVVGAWPFGRWLGRWDDFGIPCSWLFDELNHFVVPFAGCLFV